MWKPGTAKPKSSTPKTPSRETAFNGGSLTTPKSASSSAKKRLTGATLNMRFMKRKKETQQYEERRKSQSPNPALSPQAEDAFKIDPMDIEGEDIPFSRATPADMYGMQSSLIGRRSFGGFNPSMEEAWKDAKATLEDVRQEKPTQKISDEELIQRYQEISKQRSESSRPVGNLHDKVKRRKIR